MKCFFNKNQLLEEIQYTEKFILLKKKKINEKKKKKKKKKNNY